MIEMTRDNISIDPCLDVDNNWNPPCIVAYIELLFEADEKFGTHTRNRDDAMDQSVCHVQPGIQNRPTRILHRNRHIGFGPAFICAHRFGMPHHHGNDRRKVP